MSDFITSMPQPLEEGLFRLIYCSVSVDPVDDALAQSILDQARKNNERMGITGLLLADHKLFVQLLEGEARDVKALFKKISQDPRHRCVVELLRQPDVKEREYPSWSMAWGRASREEIRNIVEDAKNQLQNGKFTPWAPAVSLLSVLLDSGVGEEYGQVLQSAASLPERASA